MRVLFFGTSPFAVPTLNALHEAAPRHPLLAVVTQPDKPSGRGMKLQMSPVKKRALELGYNVLQPEKVRRKPFGQQVRDLNPDILVVVSFGQIIPQSLLDIGKGGINVHASLLPRWRGAAPIHHAIIAGDNETGVATMQMEATLDTGPVYLEEREPILEGDTVASLENRLAAHGGSLLVKTLDGIERGDITATPQSENGMTYAHPITRKDGLLDPLTETAAALHRRVRAVSPKPGAWITLGGKTVKVLKAQPLPPGPFAPTAPGTIAQIRPRGISVTTADGSLLLIEELQPENRAPMNAQAYSNGARLKVGDAAKAPDE